MMKHVRIKTMALKRCCYESWKKLSEIAIAKLKNNARRKRLKKKKR